MRKKLYLLALFTVGIWETGFSQQIWSVGPMIHFNFGGEKPRVSYALEVAYWNLEHFFIA